MKLQRVVGFFFGQNTQSLIILSPATGEKHFLLVLWICNFKSFNFLCLLTAPPEPIAQTGRKEREKGVTRHIIGHFETVLRVS